MYKLAATKVFLGDLLWFIFNAIKKILVDKKFFVSHLCLTTRARKCCNIDQVYDVETLTIWRPQKFVDLKMDPDLDVFFVCVCVDTLIL